MTGAKADKPAGDAKAHRVDVHVGTEVRRHRKRLGMSDAELAAGIGLTFHQVQKYEFGTNRISASRLYDIAQCLQVPISEFFEGLETADDARTRENHSEQHIHDFLGTTEGLAIAKDFPQIKRSVVRRRLLKLVRSLADLDD